MKQKQMRNYILILTALLLLFGCNRVDYRNGHQPGTLEEIEGARVYHLSDGILIEDRRNGKKGYYLIESTGLEGYELTTKGLALKINGKTKGTLSTTPAPDGYIAAMITLVPGETAGFTRFAITTTELDELLENLSAGTTTRDVYSLRK